MCLGRVLENHEDQPIPGPIKAWKVVLKGKKALSCFEKKSITKRWQTDKPGDRITSFSTKKDGVWESYKTGFHTYFTKEAAQEALNSWSLGSWSNYAKTCKIIPVEIMDITTIGFDGSTGIITGHKNYVSQKIRLFPVKMEAKPKTKRK